LYKVLIVYCIDIAEKIWNKEKEKWLVKLGMDAVISMKASFPLSFRGFWLDYIASGGRRIPRMLVPAVPLWACVREVVGWNLGLGPQTLS
jgi:hypothetical protein